MGNARAASVTTCAELESRAPLCTRRQAAQQLGLTVSCLAKMAMHGDGPRFIKLGKSKQSPVRYRQSDIDAWLSALESTNTSAPGLVR